MFERLKSWVGKVSSDYLRKYDLNWWVHVLKEAMTEDQGEGMRVHDTMRQSAWVNIAVTKISKNIARAEPELYQGDTLIESGPLYELFQHPNPTMSRYELWEATSAFYRTRGEYIWIFNDGFTLGIPKEIQVIDPRYFKHHLDAARRKITMWTYEPPNTQEPIPFMPDELIHSHEWNPWDPWRGVNPMTGLSMEIDQGYLASKSNLNLLRNGSVPGGILTAEGPISEDEAKAVKERWKAQHGGTDRAHEIAVTGYGVKYQQIQQSNEDMQYFDLLKWGRSAILAKYGVPPAVAGVKDDTSPLSGADTNEQMKLFWSGTLIPLLHQFEDDTNRKLLSRVAGKIELRFNIDEIHELQEDEDKRYTRYIGAVIAGVLKQNEAREKLAFEDKVPWGDTWWKPMGLEDVNAPEPEPVIQPGFQVTEEAFNGTIHKATKALYSEIYKTNHWWKMANAMDTVEARYVKELKRWLFDQRARALRVVASAMKAPRDLEAEMLEAEYWEEQTEQLKKISNRAFVLAMEATGADLAALFSDLRISIPTAWDIHDTNAVFKLRERVNQGKLREITDTMREQLRGTIQEGIEAGWTEAEMANSIRDRYNIAQNRAQAIARTELGGVVNDSRVEGFKDVGFRKHSWLSARDGSVRIDPYNHAIDGETVDIGDTFSNGLRWPNDIQGEPGNCINCRCLSLPEEDADKALVGKEPATIGK